MRCIVWKTDTWVPRATCAIATNSLYASCVGASHNTPANRMIMSGTPTHLLIKSCAELISFPIFSHSRSCDSS
uniref:Uncharacterized protein n=1 Tax=Arundo donax TaxID=35708 RepID=A0A0A9AK18_ARUDO